MADTFTAHYNLTKPQIGGDPDTWGTLLNANFDAIDTQMYANNTLADAALPKAGGTMTGALTIAPTSTFASTTLDKAASGSASVLFGQLAGASRWAVLVGDATAEAGSNSGSNFAVYRYNDAGSLLDAPFVINRASATATFSVRPMFSSATPWDSANFDPANYAPLSGAVFTGGISAPTVSATGAGAVLNFDDRTSGQWAWYGTGGIARLNRAGTGDVLTVTATSLVQAADFQATSDPRLKTGVRALRRGLDELKRMCPREYVKHSDESWSDEGREEVGFLSPEVRAVLPEAVSVRDDGIEVVSYGQITALLAAAILDLDHRMALAGI